MIGAEIHPLFAVALHQMTQGGGLLQLIAQGKQDIFLTGNPQVTWFKMVYRRYTNFSIDQQIIPFDSQPDFGRRITVQIPRKGDLLGPLWMEIKLPALYHSTETESVSKTVLQGSYVISGTPSGTRLNLTSYSGFPTTVASIIYTGIVTPSDTSYYSVWDNGSPTLYPSGTSITGVYDSSGILITSGTVATITGFQMSASANTAALTTGINTIQFALTTTSQQPKRMSYTNATAHALIQEISIEIGEQEIDKQTGEWMEIWSNYTVTQDKLQAWENMIGKIAGMSSGNSTSYDTTPVGNGSLKGPLSLHVPLRFWFCKNPGLFLPLLALQYHPIRINITLRKLQDMFMPATTTEDPCETTVKPASITSLVLYGDYIHLDTEERRRFVANAHEYLIEQVQYSPTISIDANANYVQVPLEFNHPTRELYWFIQRDRATQFNQWFNYTNLSLGESIPLPLNGLDQQPPYVNQILTALLRIDGFERFDERTADYFRLVQPYQYHTNVPVGDYVYSYSFALRPEDIQPSGSMNASRLDSISLHLQMDNTVTPVRGNSSVRVYGLNHNVLRIVDGFGGILFRI